MKQSRLIIFCLLFSLCGFAQTQDYLSYKNIMSSDAKTNLKPIVSFDTMRISFVPIVNVKDKKSLVIYPFKGIEGMIALVLEKVNHVTNYGTRQNIYYDAFEKKEKRNVVITTNDKVLTAIGVIMKLASGSTFTLYYTDIQPVFREN